MKKKLPPLADFEATARVLDYLETTSTEVNPSWLPFIREVTRLITAARKIIKAGE